MTPHQQMVDDFHRVFGLQRAKFPDFHHLDGECRIRLMQEELDEFKVAWAARDPVKMLDAIGDLLYVTYGTAVAAGVDIAPYFAEIHRTNLKKAGPDGKPIMSPEGKLLKPPGWKPPDLAGLYEDLRHDQYPPRGG